MIDRTKLRARWSALTSWPSRRAVLELGLALALAALGSFVFVALQVPLPYMLGALFATTIASMAKLPVSLPLGLRAPMSTVIGVLLGSSFDAGVLAGMALWLPSLVGLLVFILVTTGVIVLFLRRVIGLDPTTAYFAATPGGLAEMTILGDREGGDMRTISLIHATRILVVVFTVPFTVRLIEGAAATGLPAQAVALAPIEALLLAGCAVVGGVLGRLLRLPAPLLMGPMVASAVAHLTGLVHGAPPAFLVAGAQMIIGASVGCRFRGVDPLEALRAMRASVGLTLLMLLFASVTALALHLTTGLPLTLLILAYVPGGLAEMGLIALAVGADPTFVATHHIARIGLVVFLAPLAFPLYHRLFGRRPPPR